MTTFHSQAQDEIHLKISRNLRKVQDWFGEKRKGYAYPFYTSVDVRDSGFKVAVVDANIYPAGFNNICPTDQESASGAVESYLQNYYKQPIKNICLLCEEHTANLNYWDNVLTLKSIIEQSGRAVRLSIPKKIERKIEIKTASGKTAEVFPFHKEGDRVVIGDRKSVV